VQVRFTDKGAHRSGTAKAAQACGRKFHAPILRLRPDAKPQITQR
jgi:hypothetical protein